MKAMSHNANRLCCVTAAYALAHFVVDLSCAVTVLGAVAATLGTLGGQEVVLSILAYDLLAFGIQLPLGALLDLHGRADAARLTIVSFALVALGILLALISSPVAAWLAVLCVGLGNALFHCEGGVEVIGESHGQSGPPGVFIATGAAGIFLGGVAGFRALVWVTPLLLALLTTCGIIIAYLGSSSNEVLGVRLPRRASDWASVILLMLAVSICNYVTLSAEFPWKSTVIMNGAAALMAVAGKMLGGFAYDALGFKRASFASLAVAAALFYVSWTSPVAGLIALLLFNMSLTTALLETVRLFDGSLGLAYGLWHFATLFGVVPSLAGASISSAAWLFACTLVLLVALEAVALLSHSKAAKPVPFHQGIK